MFYCRSIIIKPSEVAETRQKTLSADFKGSLVTSLEQVLYSNMLTRENHSLNVCKEELLTLQFCTYFRKNSYLPRLFDDVIQSYIPNGLMSWYHDYYIETKYKNYNHPKAPKKVKMYKLMGGFKILAAGLLLASFVCFLEMLSKKIQVLQRMFEIL